MLGGYGRQGDDVLGCNPCYGIKFYKEMCMKGKKTLLGVICFIKS